MMLQRLLQRFSGTPEEVFRKVQMGGLVRTARLVSNVMGNPPPTSKELPEWIEAIMAAALGRMCRYDIEGMPAPDDTEALEACREFLSGMPPQTRVEFQSLLVLVELSPFIFGPRRMKFTDLGPDEQDQVLKSWEQSPVVPQRGGFRAIKSVVMMGYWSRPETWPSIGYSVHDNPGVPSPQRERWKAREEER